MGMDVYGKEPVSETGKYFRRSVWGWRPLADYVLANAPVEAEPCKHWHTNDEDGLDGAGARALAVALMAQVADGTVRDWITGRNAGLAALEDERCTYCDGTGTRKDAVGIAHAMPTRICEATDVDGRPNPRAGQTGSCNACGGRGSKRPFATFYPLEESDITEFAAFLRDCGGFEIC